MEKFIFTPQNLDKIQGILSKYPKENQQSALLPILDLAQRQCKGWLPNAAIETVSSLLSMPVIKVYEVASFYSMFNLKKVGQYHIQICGTTPCMLCGCEKIIDVCQKHLGIKTGEITDDGKFSLVEVECLAACVNGPAAMINDTYYENLTPEKIITILDDLAESNGN